MHLFLNNLVSLIDKQSFKHIKNFYLQILCTTSLRGLVLIHSFNKLRKRRKSFPLGIFNIRNITKEFSSSFASFHCLIIITITDPADKLMIGKWMHTR